MINFEKGVNTSNHTDRGLVHIDQDKLLDKFRQSSAGVGTKIKKFNTKALNQAGSTLTETSQNFERPFKDRTI
jgi:hypothetical protein